MQRVSSYIYLLNAKFMNLCPLSIQWSLSSEFKWAINRRLISRTNFNFQPSVKLRLSRDFDLRMGDESRARGEMRKSRNHLLRLRSKSTHRARSAGNVSTQERSRFGFKILPYQHCQQRWRIFSKVSKLKESSNLRRYVIVHCVINPIAESE